MGPSIIGVVQDVYIAWYGYSSRICQDDPLHTGNHHPKMRGQCVGL